MTQKLYFVLILSLFYQINKTNAQHDFLSDIQKTIHLLDSIYWSNIYKNKCEIVEKKLLEHINATYQLDENMAITISVGLSNFVCKANKGSFQADDFIINKIDDRVNNNFSEISTKTFDKLVVEKNVGEIVNTNKKFSKTTQIICKNAEMSLFRPFMTICITFIEN